MVTIDQVEELREKMEAERSRLLASVHALPMERLVAGQPERDGEAGWSPLQQLSHLWEMELMYDSWIVAAVDRDRPDVGRLPLLRAPIELEQANDHSLSELVSGLTRERERTLQLTRSLSLDQYERTALHPVFGELTVLQWFRSFYRHDRMHRMQIEGQEPDYQPRGDAARLDQRRMRMRLAEHGLREAATMNDLLRLAREQDGNA